MRVIPIYKITNTEKYIELSKQILNYKEDHKRVVSCFHRKHDLIIPVFNNKLKNELLIDSLSYFLSYMISNKIIKLYGFIVNDEKIITRESKEFNFFKKILDSINMKKSGTVKTIRNNKNGETKKIPGKHLVIQFDIYPLLLTSIKSVYILKVYYSPYWDAPLETVLTQKINSSSYFSTGYLPIVSSEGTITIISTKTTGESLEFLQCEELPSIRVNDVLELYKKHGTQKFFNNPFIKTLYFDSEVKKVEMYNDYTLVFYDNGSMLKFDSRNVKNIIIGKYDVELNKVVKKVNKILSTCGFEKGNYVDLMGNEVYDLFKLIKSQNKYSVLTVLDNSKNVFPIIVAGVKNVRNSKTINIEYINLKLLPLFILNILVKLLNNGKLNKEFFKVQVIDNTSYNVEFYIPGSNTQLAKVKFVRIDETPLTYKCFVTYQKDLFSVYRGKLYLTVFSHGH